MAPLSSLASPQRAVLSLILQKGKTFAEIAALLEIDEPAVRERAHLALDALAPAGGAKPAARHRAAIGNYLLGQEPDRAAATFAYLERSVAGRDWARALTGELAGLADGRLPEIPLEPGDRSTGAPPDPGSAAPDALPLPPEAGPRQQPSPPTAPASATPALPEPIPVVPPAAGSIDGSAPAAVSRRGGLLLILAGLAVLGALIAAVLVLSGGSTTHRAPARPAAAQSAAPSAKLAAQITLSARGGSRAQGLAAVIVRATQRIIAIAAAKLHPTSAGLTYAAWLYNSPSDFLLVGFVPPVGASGKISVATTPLPAGVARFHTLLITREATPRATRPGTAILSGTVPAGALG